VCVFNLPENTVVQ